MEFWAKFCQDVVSLWNCSACLGMWGRLAYIWQAQQQGLLVLSLDALDEICCCNFLGSVASLYWQWSWWVIFLMALDIATEEPHWAFVWYLGWLLLRNHHFQYCLRFGHKIQGRWIFSLQALVGCLVQPWGRKLGKKCQMAESDQDPCSVLEKRLAQWHRFRVSRRGQEGSSRRPIPILHNLAFALLSTFLSNVHRAGSVAILYQNNVNKTIKDGDIAPWPIWKHLSTWPIGQLPDHFGQYPDIFLHFLNISWLYWTISWYFGPFRDHFLIFLDHFVTISWCFLTTSWHFMAISWLFLTFPEPFQTILDYFLTILTSLHCHLSRSSNS